MLGFILSKMNMLVFATALLIVSLMFLNFISGLELQNITSSNLELNMRNISGQIASHSLCSNRSITIPDFFDYGLTNNRFYYELGFRKSDFSFGDKEYTKLSLLIRDYLNKRIVDVKSIDIEGDVIFVDTSVIYESVTNQMFDIDELYLYPRQATRDRGTAPPNAFVALKEVTGGRLKMYIIPCTTSLTYSDRDDVIYTANNCEENILKVGCYLLSRENPSDSDLVNPCFSISREITTDSEYATRTVTRRDISYKDCRDLGYVS